MWKVSTRVLGRIIKLLNLKNREVATVTPRGLVGLIGCMVLALAGDVIRDTSKGAKLGAGEQGGIKVSSVCISLE